MHGIYLGSKSTSSRQVEAPIPCVGRRDRPAKSRPFRKTRRG